MFLCNSPWYADDNDCPYLEEQFCSVQVVEFNETINKMFDNMSVININTSIHKIFLLYRYGSMGHNVLTEVNIEIERSLIKTIKIYSYDTIMLIDNNNSLTTGKKYSEYINHLQMHQVIDYLNGLCGSDNRYICT